MTPDPGRSPSTDFAPFNPELSRPQCLSLAECRWVSSGPFMAMAAAVAAFSVTLAFIGFSPWRAAVPMAVAAAAGGFIVSGWRRRSAAPWLEPAAVVSLGLGIISTGGVHSPMVALSLGVPGSVVLRGLSRSFKADVIILTLSMVVAAAAGPHLGPLVPDPWNSIYLVLFFVSGLALAVSFVVSSSRALDASSRELSWARNNAAEQVKARAQELELVSSQLSHELKNPLAAIKGLVQVTLRASAESGTQERLQVVEAEIDRMVGILQDYLSFARPLSTPSLMGRDLALVVDDVLAVMEARARSARVKLVRAGKARAMVDERRIREALVNLVGNAIEASSAGQTVRVNLSEGDGRARVVVEDRGHGMPAEVLGKLGTPFFTTREHGNGLGVMVARGVFKLHGGALEFHSEPGKGTTAVGTLLAESASKGLECALPRADERERRTERARAF